MNKPPSYIEGDSNWKENDTAKKSSEISRGLWKLEKNNVTTDPNK